MFNKNKDYYKLIRDKMPEIIKKDGYIPEIEILSKSELKYELREKLIEESTEVLNALNSKQLLKELADVYEVICCLASKNNFSITDVKNEAARKRKERGSFNKGIFLVRVKKS